MGDDTEGLVLRTRACPPTRDGDKIVHRWYEDPTGLREADAIRATLKLWMPHHEPTERQVNAIIEWRARRKHPELSKKLSYGKSANTDT